MERQDLRANSNSNQNKKKDTSHGNESGCSSSRGSSSVLGGRNGRGGGPSNSCGHGLGRGDRSNNNNNGEGKLKVSDTCPLPNHSGHTWDECFQSVANTNNRHNNGGGSGGGNNNRNNNRGNVGDAHVNEDTNQGNDNNSNNDNSSRSSNSGRSSRQSNINNNNQNNMYLVTVDGTDQRFDMYHVDDKISEAYYYTNTSRFNVNLSDNFENYPIGDFMCCQEVIPSIESIPRSNLSVNDIFYDSNSSSEYDQVPLLVARHQEPDSNTDSE